MKYKTLKDYLEDTVAGININPRKSPFIENFLKEQTIEDFVIVPAQNEELIEEDLIRNKVAKYFSEQKRSYSVYHPERGTEIFNNNGDLPEFYVNITYSSDNIKISVMDAYQDESEEGETSLAA